MCVHVRDKKRTWLATLLQGRESGLGIGDVTLTELCLRQAECLLQDPALLETLALQVAGCEVRHLSRGASVDVVVGHEVDPGLLRVQNALEYVLACRGVDQPSPGALVERDHLTPDVLAVCENLVRCLGTVGDLGTSESHEIGVREALEDREIPPLEVLIRVVLQAKLLEVIRLGCGAALFEEERIKVLLDHLISIRHHVAVPTREIRDISLVADELADALCLVTRHLPLVEKLESEFQIALVRIWRLFELLDTLDPALELVLPGLLEVVGELPGRGQRRRDLLLASESVDPGEPSGAPCVPVRSTRPRIALWGERADTHVDAVGLECQLTDHGRHEPDFLRVVERLNSGVCTMPGVVEAERIVTPGLATLHLGGVVLDLGELLLVVRGEEQLSADLPRADLVRQRAGVEAHDRALLRAAADETEREQKRSQNRHRVETSRQHHDPLCV